MGVCAVGFQLSPGELEKDRPTIKGMQTGAVAERSGSTKRSQTIAHSDCQISGKLQVVMTGQEVFDWQSRHFFQRLQKGLRIGGGIIGI